MRRADRLFRLVQLLRKHRIVTAATLAEELEVSVRTVYRDVRDLELSGVPIEGEAGVGYRLARGYELPPMTFTPDELESLVLGVRMVRAWSDPELATAAASALEKVEAVLPRPLRQLLGNTALFAPGRPWRDPPSHLGILRRAIARHRKVAFHYQRADGQSSQRVVRPLALYCWGSVWSMGAWCEFREDWRIFRPDRMQRVRELAERFDPAADGIDLDAFTTAERERERAREHPRHQGTEERT